MAAKHPKKNQLRKDWKKNTSSCLLSMPVSFRFPVNPWVNASGKRPCSRPSFSSTVPNRDLLSLTRSWLHFFFATFQANLQVLRVSFNRACGGANSTCLRVHCYLHHALTRPHTQSTTHTTPLHATTLHFHLPPYHSPYTSQPFLHFTSTSHSPTPSKTFFLQTYWP